LREGSRNCFANFFCFMRQLLFLLSLLLLANSCRKDIYPERFAGKIDFSAITSNKTDEVRLCIADAIARTLSNKSVRKRIKELSVSVSAHKHREILLWDLLNQPEFETALNKVLTSGTSRCYKDVASFKNDVAQDASLVIKLPDIIALNEWNADKMEPFLYVRTNDLVHAKKETEEVKGMMGFHSTGLTDMYVGEMTDYLPLALKPSEDHWLLNADGILFNGVPLRQLHYFDARMFSSLDLGGKSLILRGQTYYWVNINDFLKQIAQQEKSLVTDYYESPCTTGDCAMACIPMNRRQIVCDSIGIHSNKNDRESLKNLFVETYRPMGYLALYDNVIPGIFYRVTDSLQRTTQQTRKILGSFRLRDLFDLQSVRTFLSQEECSVNGQTVVLYQTRTVFTVQAARSVKTEPFQLLKNFNESDKMSFSLVRLYFDMETREFPTLFGNTVRLTHFESDFTGNTYPYCPTSNRRLGNEAVAVKIRF
jgi:hypothetical protein